jgi:hypothetical protein
VTIFPIEYLVIPLVFAFVMLLIMLAAQQRSRREQHRLELQKAVLERVGSVKDFAEFLTTEQGERFLASLAPVHFRTHHSGLWSVRIGVVLVTIGLFVFFGLHTPFFGSPAESTTPLLVIILLVIAVGVGMLVSAAVSFMIARALGLSNGRTSRKGDAG